MRQAMGSPLGVWSVTAASPFNTTHPHDEMTCLQSFTIQIYKFHWNKKSKAKHHLSSWDHLPPMLGFTNSIGIKKSKSKLYSTLGHGMTYLLQFLQNVL